jgi:tRNA U34 5-carboxymethylaminomethyl modifying GTPase MnmE/TrmE
MPDQHDRSFDELPLTPAGRLASAARRLALLARELGHADLATTIADDARRRLDDGRVRVVVLGEIKHGKSSLINALLGAPLLPVGVTPTTGAVVAIRVDPDRQAARTGTFVVYPDGSRDPLERERFDALARGRSVPIEPAANQSPAESDQPARQLEPGGVPELLVEAERMPATIELIDTPGFNDIAKFRAAISRGELPRADVLVLVLDATQVLSRSELALIRDAIAAVGGLGESGARCELVINRIDLVPEEERPRIIEHLREQLEGVLPSDLEPFTTNAKLALREPDDASPAVQAVAALRAKLFGLAGEGKQILPARARSAMLRHARLLGYNAAVQARALHLERETIAAEIVAVERAMSDQARDLELLRKQIQDSGGKIRLASEQRQAAFRRELEESATQQISTADLHNLTQVVPGAIQDAFLEFVHGESERLRGELDELTRDVFATHGELARRRLFEATLPLGFRGPGLYVDPPAILIEVGMLALGLVGTILWYFGSAMTGMLITIASPITTVILREKTVRDARAQANRALPDALDAAVAQLGNAVEQVVTTHDRALDEHLMLADRALGEQLIASLQMAAQRLDVHEAKLEARGVRRSSPGAEPGSAALPPEVATRRLRERVAAAAQAELDRLEQQLAALVSELETLELGEPSADEGPTVLH